MRLEYKILCIDNDIKSLEDTKDQLSATNESVGIETLYADIQAEPSATEGLDAFKKRMEAELKEKFNDDGPFDLILIDLHLQDQGQGIAPINGSHFVSMVRQGHTIYRPIVFYSGGNETDVPNETSDPVIAQLNQASKEANIHGKSVMVCHRDDLPRCLDNIVKEMHAEEHKTNNVRGLLMDQLSEMDALCIEIIEKLWTKVPSGQQQNVENKVKERVKNSVTNATKSCKLVAKANYLKLPDVYVTSGKKCDLSSRLIILKALLEQFDGYVDNTTTLKELFDSNKKIPDISLSHIRNEYAHQSAKKLGQKQNDARCKYIRTEIRKHIENLKSILENIE